MDMSNQDITSSIIECIQRFINGDAIHCDTNILVDDVNTSLKSNLVIDGDMSINKNLNIEENDINSIVQNEENKIIDKLSNSFNNYSSFGYLTGTNPLSMRITSNLINSIMTGGIISENIIDKLNNSSMLGLAEEISTEPVIDGTLFCDQCSFHTNDQICMLDHTMIYHDGAFNEYACNRCDAYFSSMDELDNHIQIAHAKKEKKILKKEQFLEPVSNICSGDTPCIKEMYEDNEDEYDEDDDIPGLEHIENVENFTNLGNNFQRPEQANDFLKPMKVCVKKSFKKSVQSEQIDFSLDGSGKKDEINKDYFESDEDEPAQLPTLEEIEYQKLHRWSSARGKFTCQICKLNFSSQGHLGEHFMANHQSYEEQLELDAKLATTSFPSFEVLNVMNYITFPEFDDYYDNCCEICCKEYLIGHNKKIKLINSSFIDEYKGYTLYPLIINCCEKHICHECLKGYLNSSHLNGLLVCPYCQQDKTRYDIDYVRVFDICCDKKSWTKWWMKEDKIDTLASEKHSLCYDAGK
jgi:hypothetical protein